MPAGGAWVIGGVLLGVVLSVAWAYRRIMGHVERYAPTRRERPAPVPDESQGADGREGGGA